MDQPKALALADALEAETCDALSQDAANELRRLCQYESELERLNAERDKAARKKKQSSRMMKAFCKAEGCGYTVRLSRKWADKLGAVCPEHGMMDIEIPAGAVEDPADD